MPIANDASLSWIAQTINEMGTGAKGFHLKRLELSPRSSTLQWATRNMRRLLGSSIP